jgi:DNA polymerase V
MSLLIHAADTARPYRPCALPLFASRVAAGFPSPAEDFIEGQLDLNAHLIHRPAASFFVRVAGDSMTGAGIHPGDLLVVDRSLEARPGDIVIAAVGSELTVKRLKRRAGGPSGTSGYVLAAENPAFPVVEIADGQDCLIWGVVTSTVRRFDKR